MRDRRRVILDLLRVRDGLTVADVGRELRLTRTAAASHMARLLAEGSVQRVGLRPGKRRPSVVFSLTPQADRLFHQEYEQFALDLLAELKRESGTRLNYAIRRIAEKWIARDAPALAGLRGRARFERATNLLAHHGLMPVLEAHGNRHVLRQHNCPILSLCRDNREAPELLRRWIEGLFGTSVKRTQCICQGARSCAYEIGSLPAKARGRAVAG